MRKRTDTITGVAPESKLLLSIDEAAVMLSLGRTVLYDLVTRREIFSVKVGRTRRIPASALRDFVDRLCDLQRAS